MIVMRVWWWIEIGHSVRIKVIDEFEALRLVHISEGFMDWDWWKWWKLMRIWENERESSEMWVWDKLSWILRFVMRNVYTAFANYVLKFTCNSPEIQLLVTNGKFCLHEFVGLNPLCCVCDVYNGIKFSSP